MKRICFIVGLFGIIIITIISMILFHKKDNKITVAEVTHSVFYTPFYVSIHNGYFKEEDLDIDVILTSGADKVTSALLSGDGSIGLSGLEATLYVYKNNAKDYLVTFSSLTKRDGQFLFGDCKYKNNFNVTDLIGKSIIVGRKGGMPSMVFNYALYKNGISDKDVYIDTSVDYSSLSSAYIRGESDFVNLFEPNATLLEKEGYGCVLDSIGLLSGEVPYTVFHAKKSYIDNNPDVIKKFNKAIKKGLEFVNNNGEETIANIIKDEFPDTNINDLKSIIKRYKDVDTWHLNTFIKEEDYNNLIDLMIYNGELTSEDKLDFNTLVTNKYSE